ncbi:3-hydroxyisobutyrate dehydrogenase [Roseateles sp. YR242]|uniref:NAD(P)-dependent oxidoreductase n=1 Tax=Roseateles sp. YR242 TaxID=1855305 RepID=UPI0008D441EF|nr:NAD(P)-dependent oxidoreductase [Roseateles sp. YR242]SEL65744.1 3-hydroxyisobutyrate dehydrogenase [Roseateles sp. YR242]
MSDTATQTPADGSLRIGLVGYGEVGRILAEDLRAAGHAVSAYDLKLESPSAQADAMREHAAAHGVTLSTSATMVATGAELVISAVTASETLNAARGCAAGLTAGTFVLDFNSASPGAKQQAAEVVDGHGGRYVEGAVMTSVPPYRIKVPLLLGGPHAQTLMPVLERLGFAPKVHDERLGVASATKMCRSVMIKGLEAMVIESFTTARHYGVEDAVVASLQETFPGIDWEKQAAYFFQRVIQHGRRRSEEVREVAVTVREAGLVPWSADGTAERQAWVADLADSGVFGDKADERFARSPDWRTEADRLLAQVAKAPGQDD